ncbi:uncharacterized protein LOC144707768 [Wolffia australiana]
MANSTPGKVWTSEMIGRCRPEDAAKIEFDINPSSASRTTSSMEKMVWLRDWWLIKARDESNRETLGVGGVSASGKAARIFHSAPIVKRFDTFNVETMDGITIKIQGLINVSRTKDNGFPPEACNNFRIGFPYAWKQYGEKYFQENANERVPSKASVTVDCSLDMPDPFMEFPKKKILECLHLLIKEISKSRIGTNDSEEHMEKDVCTNINTNRTIPPEDRDADGNVNDHVVENVSSPVTIPAENLKKSSGKKSVQFSASIGEENMNYFSRDTPDVAPPTCTPNQERISTSERPFLNECTPTRGFSEVHTSTKRNMGLPTAATPLVDLEALGSDDDDQTVSKTVDKSKSPAKSFPAEPGIPFETSSWGRERHQEGDRPHGIRSNCGSNKTNLDQVKVINSAWKTPRKQLSFADEEVPEKCCRSSGVERIDTERVSSPSVVETLASSPSATETRAQEAKEGVDLNTVPPDCKTSDSVHETSHDRSSQPPGSSRVLRRRSGRLQKSDKSTLGDSDSSSSKPIDSDKNESTLRGKSVQNMKSTAQVEMDERSSRVLRQRRVRLNKVTKAVTGDSIPTSSKGAEMDIDDSSSLRGKSTQDKMNTNERAVTDVPSVVGSAKATPMSRLQLFSMAKGQVGHGSKKEVRTRNGSTKVDIFSFSDESEGVSSVDSARVQNESITNGKSNETVQKSSVNTRDLLQKKKALATNKTPKSSEKRPSASKAAVKSPLLNREKGSLSFASPELLKLKRSKSGRVIVPKLANWCQQILYQDGSIAGILTGVDAISCGHPGSRTEPPKKRKKFL